MPVSNESPCFGCVGVNGNKAPCCWNLTLFISNRDPLNIQRFRDAGLEARIAYGHKNRISVEVGIRFTIPEACPFLVVDTGECELQFKSKPFNCSWCMPLEDFDCTSKRDHQIIPIDGS